MAENADALTGGRTRTRRHRRWWQGGSSVRPWRIEMLGLALLGLGVGLLLQVWIEGLLGTLLLWVCLLAPVVWALTRSVPRGLFRFHWHDLLAGLVLAMLLRLTQGWLEVAFGGSGALPSYPSLNGALPERWWIDGVLVSTLSAPVIEELFFRGLLLIAVFTLVRRFAGHDGRAVPIAGFVAVTVSAGAFALAHALLVPAGAASAISLLLLGAVAGTLVATTGRIWGAVLVHVLFNASGVLLTVAGTLLG